MKIEGSKVKWKDLKKSDKTKVILFFLIRLIVVGLIITSIFELIFAKENDTMSKEEVRSRTAFILTNCVLTLGATMLPSILERQLKVEIPSLMEIIFVVFTFLALILGEIGNFYAKFDWWDDMLHGSSGILITSLGFIVLNTLNKSDKVASKMNPVFICIFAFCFSVCIGAIWEIIEWTIDGFAGTNMQRFSDNDTRVLFEGRDALRDTMGDIILETCTSLVVAVIGYIDLRCRKQFVPNLVLHSKEVTKKEKKEDTNQKENEDKNLKDDTKEVSE